MGRLTPKELDKLLAGKLLPEDRMESLANDPEALRELSQSFAIVEAAGRLRGDPDLMARSPDGDAENESGAPPAGFEPDLRRAAIAHPADGTGPQAWPHARGVAIAAAALHGVLNYLLSYRTESEVSYTTYWQQTQDEVVVVGLTLAGVIALLLILFRELQSWRGRGTLPRFPFVGTMFGAAFLVSLGLWANAWFSEQSRAAAVEDLLANHRWCAFEPPRYDPYREGDPYAGTRDTLRAELVRVCAPDAQGARLDGIITFDARGGMAQVPVLLGELDPTIACIFGIRVSFHDKDYRIEQDRAEIRASVAAQIESAVQAAEHIDAVCLGHNSRVPLEDLAAWADEIRGKVDKPVTTTFTVTSYEGRRGRQLRELGDFLFIDVEPEWHSDWSPRLAIAHFREVLARVQQLPTAKPCLLKMVSFPSAGGGPGLTEANQRLFLDRLRDVILPPGQYVSLFNSHDIPWKQGANLRWSGAERHVGLFTADPEPRAKPAFDAARRLAFGRLR